MAEEYQRVVDLPVKTSSGISLLSDYLMGIDSSDGYQMLINDLAKKIVEDYIGSSLGGTSRTLKTVLDAICTQIGSTTMGTTATTLTGAIKEHQDEIGTATMGTTATTLTGAIAEHEGDISGITDDVGDIDDFIGDTSMGTMATTITGAIAEHESDISTLNSKLTGLQNNKTSSGVNLKNYTQSNPYTFPYDGYVLLDSGSSAQSGTHIWFNIRTANNYNAANLYMAVQQSYQSMSVFVKKGMFCFLYDATATNNFSIIFYPLDMS